MIPMDDSDSGIASDYQDYETAKELEGGLHGGRSDPARSLLWTAAVVIGVVLVVLALVGLLVK
jgi:hypothetical protein